METTEEHSKLSRWTDSIQKVSIEQIADRIPSEYRDKLIREFQIRTKNGRKLRIYTDGWWDMFHYGHARLLEQIKKLYDNVEIIVGVCASEDIKAHKGICVMSDDERIDSLKHCRWVDDVYYPAPWTPTTEFLDSINADFVAQSSSNAYEEAVDGIYKQINDQGRFLPMTRTTNVSASDLLIRVLKDKDDYIERNLKKGYTRQQLNLGLFEYFLLKTRRAAKNIQKSLGPTEGDRL